MTLPTVKIPCPVCRELCACDVENLSTGERMAVIPVHGGTRRLCAGSGQKVKQ